MERLLLLFLLGIALFANFAFFGSLDAAFVLAGLAFFLGLFATGFCLSKGDAAQECYRAKQCDE